jgi:membrane associated rhomboid family serine protease
MFFDSRQLDNQPIGNFRGFPIYLTTILVASVVAGVIFSALGGMATAFAWFGFDPELFWRRGQIWRLLTYVTVNQANFFTIFNLLFLYAFGRDCEREMGRGRYLAFLGLLIATPALIATVLWLAGFGGGVLGSTHLSIGLVIGFATIYPNVPWWGEIPMKFVAVGCMFLAAVGHLSQGDQIGLGSTLATCAVSFGYIRGMRAGWFSGFSWKIKFRRAPKPAGQPVAGRRTSGDVDALLDKIAKSGFQSLTAEEKLRLEAAREELLKRGRS